MHDPHAAQFYSRLGERHFGVGVRHLHCGRDGLASEGARTLVFIRRAPRALRELRAIERRPGAARVSLADRAIKLVMCDSC